MEITLGGERVGSGNKMNLHLRNYERSTHNLSTRFASSMGIGILYPCYCKPVLRGDKFEMNIAAGARTVPSRGAMFGSYKLQVDYYFCPARLYVGILHNNPINIGLEMNKVYFPQFTQHRTKKGGETYEKLPNANNSLLHYLGISGLGCTHEAYAERSFNAIPMLAYYDIFKNYYSNKQEEKAYVLHTGTQTIYNNPTITSVLNLQSDERDNVLLKDNIIQSKWYQIAREYGYKLLGQNMTLNNVYIELWDGVDELQYQRKKIISLYDAQENGTISVGDTESDEMYIEFNTSNTIWTNWRLYTKIEKDNVQSNLGLVAFDLKNIDEMRAELLSWHTLGAPYNVNNFNKFPYKAITEIKPRNISQEPDDYNNTPLNGLMLKTYQSDMFNNWLSSEMIDGANGIAELTRVSAEGGGFTIDALNFSEKMYNLLNRIAVSGSTYEDWQDVVYEQTPKRHLESPMYLGGLSQEIVFEEIVSTAVTNEGKLGEMGGRGISKHRKGGKIRAKFDEAGFIMGIVSITPRVAYGQTNEFFNTDIFTMDDFHKPGLDGIGFQDLLGERMAYFDTQINADGSLFRHAVGKLPAWIDYMTDVDRLHGDFADENAENFFMVLNRNYAFNSELGCIDDATTYVEPNKYNYTFAYTELDAQNFWVQINMDIPARRKMSAKQIPNI